MLIDTYFRGSVLINPDEDPFPEPGHVLSLLLELATGPFWRRMI